MVARPARTDSRSTATHRQAPRQRACADINGDKPNDQVFCACPDGFACTPLVTSIGQGNEGLTGSYCIKDNTAYNKDTACNQGDCDPATKKCGE